MARLLRAHFSSIGYRDARLAPLTLDFRHAGAGRDSGTGADTVIWLRNGGGKSSILNLFYSVFRPNAREFLGTSAEGKARRLEQYVKGRDLAFVVTEWDVEAPAEPTLFAQAPVRTRVVGQVLAWKNQRISSDTSNLRRMFFSLLTRPGEVELDSLPILGLGEPVDSFDGFRDWLRDLQHRATGSEVVFTDHQQKWHTHLEQIGLDPELFRYQLAMNQREGAADEVFRFRRDADFVQFLLELAFDPRIADQIAANLQAQRDNLRERPRWELERRFVGEGLHSMRPLAAATADDREASAAMDEATLRTAATVTALDLAGLEHKRAADEARAAAQAAKDRARRADNDRTRKQRWMRGLQRLALQFDEAEARARMSEAAEFLAQAEAEVRAAEAAIPLRKLRTIEAECTSLREALERAEADIEPLRQAARERGGRLRALLERERSRVDELHEQVGRLEVSAEHAAEVARARAREAAARAGGLTKEVADLEARIARRDRARELLLERGRLQSRETAADGLVRWEQQISELAAAQGRAQAQRDEAAKRADAVTDRTTDLTGERARYDTRRVELTKYVDEAYAWRDRLRTDPKILEVEGVDEASPEAPGLEARLRHRADVARRRGTDSRVEGAEDQRSLEWLREHGLLPSPLDVQRVVAALAEHGVSAHAAPSYLEGNAPVELRRALIGGDPARYSGVVVLDAQSLQRAREIVVDGLRIPVVVSTITELVTGPGPSDAVVLPPDSALYDTTAADRRRPELDRAVARRSEDERSHADEEDRFREIAGEVARFVAAHGGGKLDALDRERRGAEQQVELADAELKKLADEAAMLVQTRAALESRLGQLRDNGRDAELAAEAIRSFITEHDAEIEAVRARKDEAGQQLRVASSVALASEADASKHAAAAKEHHGRRVELQGNAQRLRSERDRVALFDDEASIPRDLTLEAARATYETAVQQYQREIRADKIQAQLEEKERSRAEVRREYQGLARGLDPAGIEGLAARADLEDERRRLRQAEHEHLTADATARAQHEQIRERLEEANQRRRDAEDLPAGMDPPPDAASARERAQDLALQAEADGAAQERALGDARVEEGAANDRDRTAHECGAHAGALRSVAEGAQVDLPELPAAELEADRQQLADAVAALRSAFTNANKHRNAARRTVHECAEGVRRVANRQQYTELRARYQERMKESTDVLASEAESLVAALEIRLGVIEQALAKLDEDRRLIIEELLHVADQAATLLERAERASRLPAAIEGWAGRSYVRVKFQFPGADEERRSLLAPMVDRLVEQAQIPGGVELVFRTAVELAGARGFEVLILKPDAEPRPDPIPIHQMSTFSRGQQLTAAILLYCTLVQLRARTRGRAHGTQDAGVLILDNPIGTCSNVTLLQLQRTIAAQMRVQLIYTTGVDDLEALQTLPNKIRLRNTHRDRSTGDYHVTEEEPDRSIVEGVRLVEVPAR